MRTIHRLILLPLLLIGLRAAAADYQPDLNRLLSALQSMSHGAPTPAEWQGVLAELDTVSARATREGDYGAVVQAQAIKAMALADMRKDIPGALAVLEQAKRDHGHRKLDSVKRLYIQQAELYSRLGDEAAVRRVIEEFRGNPNYDPHSYEFTVGEGRNTPLTLVRPTARGADSVSVTAMEVYRERARFAPGSVFPSFQLADGQGGRVALADYRGKVLLIDFWQAGWTPWERDVEYQVSLYRRYQPHGLDVLGMALGSAAAAREHAVKKGLPWRQVYGDRALARQLGIFGDATNFLLDRNGVIIGRNLRGAELAAAVHKALNTAP